MAKPVISRTKSASARAMVSPAAAATFFSSTRQAPETTTRTGRLASLAAKDERLGDLGDCAPDRRRGLGGGARARVELDDLKPLAERGLDSERRGTRGGLHRRNPISRVIASAPEYARTVTAKLG
jgi:hypothetical protein